MLTDLELLADHDDGPHLIAICRGPDKGCTGKALPCPDCYRVMSNDRRSTAQIIRDMERGDA